MRVIAGKARRLLLKTVEGKEIRPTTDRIKETLFNMLLGEIEGSVFLDLFAGSGAIGIEALSRGAKKAYFVDKNSKAIACIEENLKHTKLYEEAKIIRSDAVSALTRIEQSEKEPLDIIFMDPPYDEGIEERVIERLIKMDLINSDTLIIIELSKNRDTDFLRKDWEILKIKEYKSNKHIFLKRRRIHADGSLSGEF